MDLLFASLSCCIIQLHLNFKSLTDDWWIFSFRISWKRELFMVLLIWANSLGPEAAKHSQTITLPPLCFAVDIFLLWNPVLALHHMGPNWTHVLQKIPTHLSTEHYPKRLRGQGVSGKCKMSLYVPLGQQYFFPPCKLPMDTIFGHSFSNDRIMNTGIICGELMIMALARVTEPEKPFQTDIFQ